jgi:hypothetical protein
MLQFWIAPAAWRVNENEQAALAIRRRLSDGLIEVAQRLMGALGQLPPFGTGADRIMIQQLDLDLPAREPMRAPPQFGKGR